MFDIGFLEILMIMIIALIVIGPERMPEIARKIGSFVGKTRNFINTVKQENQFDETVQDFKKSMDMAAQEQQISNIHKELQDGLNMGMENVNLDDFQRPFGGDIDKSSSSFNRAPSQPQLNTPKETAETSTQPTPASESTVSTESAPASQPVPTAQASTENSNTQDSASKNTTDPSKS
jgi:sec-independent protein translocase protein TatB